MSFISPPSDTIDSSPSPESADPGKQRWRRWAGIGLGTLALAGLSIPFILHPNAKKAGMEKRPVAVVATTVTRKTVPLIVQTTGTVQAYATVAVKSQLDGQLVEVYFQEGQTVHQGELLFKIDPRPLQAAVDQAVANRARAIAQVAQAQAQVAQAEAQVAQARAAVDRDQAQSQNATVEAQRYLSLQDQGAISREQADQYTTNAKAVQSTLLASQSNVGNALAAVEAARANLLSAQAAVSAADAQLENARVQLSYTNIASPLDGRLGKLNVNQGNLVKANDTNPLVSISQIHPIYVTFFMPQQRLADLKRYQARGKIRVEAMAPNAQGQPARGELVFVDSGVDPATGMIQLKARFSNQNGQLTPGEFVNVTVKLADEPDAIVVPATAIQDGQKGTFVYVIQPDQTVAVRPVTVEQTMNGQTIVRSGLQMGDRVVVDGQFNLAPGVAVQEKQPGAADQDNQPGNSQHRGHK